MREIIQANRFDKDVVRIQKRGYNISSLRDIIVRIRNETMTPKDRDHQLKGKYKAYRGCHLTGDWILLYREIDETTIELYRTGTHADIFKDRY